MKQSSRGQKRQGEDVQFLTAKAEEQHIDADVEMLAHKTWRVEVVVGLKFVSCATRLGLREGLAVDLTTVRANGTMWDLSVEGDRAQLRRMQNREQPELLAGSPPSDDFSSLLNSCG